MIARLKREVARLKAELAIARGEIGGDATDDLPDYEKERYFASSSIQFIGILNQQIRFCGLICILTG